MNIVIIGGGKVGSLLASQLTSEGHDVTVVDKDQKALDAISATEDVLCVCGAAIGRDTLEQANVSSADIAVACTDSDEINMLACLLAKKAGAERTIARVRDPEYFDQIINIKEDLGLSFSINPELSAAETIDRVLMFPAADSVEAFSRSKAELVEFEIEKGNELAGMTLIDIGNKYKSRVLICAVVRGEKTFIPTGTTKLEVGDKIYVASSHGQMRMFFKQIDSFKSQVKSVIIVGGSRVSYYLAKILCSHGMTVKIIESNQKKCDKLAEFLPEAMIVHADGSDKQVLAEEGLGSADAFVSMTGIDEVNALLALYAKKQGVDKVIAKINEDSFNSMIKGFGIDSIVSAKTITANQILRYVRAIDASSSLNNIESLSKLVDGNVESLEFAINETASYVGVKLRDLETNDGYLVAVIIRGRKIIVPGGDDSIEIGDHVLVVTTHAGTQKLEEVFK